MAKIIDLSPPSRRDPARAETATPMPRGRLPNGAGRRSPRVQLRVPLLSMAEAEQNLDTLEHAISRAKTHLRRAKRTGAHLDALDALEMVRKTLERSNKLINAKRIPIDREEAS